EMVPADPGLLNYLEQMQADVGPHPSRFQPLQPEEGTYTHHNVLRQIREQDAIRQAPELDRGTVDALAEVFDYVFADPSIPMQMKVVIGRLQIPVLRAAMLDRDFFLSSDHPARKLVDTLSSSSVAWTPEKGEEDPLYQRIEHTVQRVLVEFEDDLTLFSQLLAEFTEFLFESEQQAQQHIEPVADKERDQEALNAALAHADEIVHARLSALPDKLPLVPFLKPFLTTEWRQVIAAAWLREDSEPGRWNATLQTIGGRTVRDDTRTLQPGEVLVWDSRIAPNKTAAVLADATARGAGLIVSDVTAPGVHTVADAGLVLAAWARQQFPQQPAQLVGVTGTS
ncbi:MAG: DUF1631 family protein, partial [Burkholderiaceae bacterium]